MPSPVAPLKLFLKCFIMGFVIKHATISGFELFWGFFFSLLGNDCPFGSFIFKKILKSIAV